MQDSVSININLIKEESRREAIPKGYKCTPTLVKFKKEGPVEVFTPDSVLYANLNYHEDLLDGLCEYYDRGVLIEKISYKNGKEDGWSCVFENGKEKEKISEKTTKNLDEEDRSIEEKYDDFKELEMDLKSNNIAIKIVIIVIVIKSRKLLHTHILLGIRMIMIMLYSLMQMDSILLKKQKNYIN